MQYFTLKFYFTLSIATTCIFYELDPYLKYFFPTEKQGKDLPVHFHFSSLLFWLPSNSIFSSEMHNALTNPGHGTKIFMT